MKVYVFGNVDTPLDDRAFIAAEKLKGKIKDVEFIEVGTNRDLPFSNGEDAVILDTISGIKEVKILGINDLDKIALPAKTTVHDFDLAFQLKYLKKLGKLGDITIIGIPQEGEVDHNSIQSILRKLVAQDMQGS